MNISDAEDDMNKIPIYEIKNFSKKFREIKEEYLIEKEGLKKDTSAKSIDLTEIAFKDIIKPP
jgi:hypothetical protein